MAELASENMRLRATLAEQIGSSGSADRQCLPLTAWGQAASTVAGVAGPIEGPVVVGPQPNSGMPAVALGQAAVLPPEAAPGRPVALVVDGGTMPAGSRASTPCMLRGYTPGTATSQIHASSSGAGNGAITPPYCGAPLVGAHSLTPRVKLVGAQPEEENLGTFVQSGSRTPPMAPPTGLFAAVGLAGGASAGTPRRAPGHIGRSTSVPTICRSASAHRGGAAPVPVPGHGWLHPGAPLGASGLSSAGSGDPAPVDSALMPGPVGTSTQLLFPAARTGTQTPPAAPALGRPSSTTRVGSYTAPPHPQQLLQMPAAGATMLVPSLPSGRGGNPQAPPAPTAEAGGRPGGREPKRSWSPAVPRHQGTCQTPPQPRPRENLLRQDPLPSGPPQRRRSHIQKSLILGCQ